MLTGRPMQARTPRTDDWPKWAGAFLLLTAVLACDEKKSPKSEAPPEDRPLLEPLERDRDLMHRCRALPGGNIVTLRAPTSKEAPGALEAGSAVAVDGGFVVGLLRTEKESWADVVYLDGRGASKTTKLSRVHGSVEAPQVARFGPDAIVVVPDNDAGHSRLRLAKVKSPATRSEISWGPEIQVRRGESQAFSVAVFEPEGGKEPAVGVIAWDDFDKATLRSQVRALSFDPASMKALGSERAVTPTEEDAGDPMIVGGETGSSPFWALWLSYQSIDKSSPSDALVDEPPRVLRVQKLDALAQPDGPPLTISEEQESVLAFDAKVHQSGSLAVAYRSAEGGRNEGASPVHLRVVDVGGAVVSQTVSHEELGLGAPALFRVGTPSTMWLSARGNDSDILLGKVEKDARVLNFSVEAGLSERIPLSGSENALLVMEPDGLDLRFSSVVCGP